MSDHKRKKRIIGIAVGTLTAVAIIIIAASFYMLDYSLAAYHRPQNEGIERLNDHAPCVSQWADSVITHNLLRDTTITIGNLKHHAYFLPADSVTNRTAILVHGYKDCAISMLHIGYLYHHDLGYNILLPNLYGHGQTEGDHIGMGWNERNDILQWITFADNMFKGDRPQTETVLHGISMGAATVMTTGGEKLPPCVKAIVEDCGYTSVWDEFSAQLKEQFGLSEFPLMYTSSALCKMRYGWSFGEASPLDQVKKCRLPMLFIHGDNDTFVPTEMVHRLYKAKSDPKQLWLAPGSEHARAYGDHQTEYTRQVRDFLAQYIN